MNGVWYRIYKRRQRKICTTNKRTNRQTIGNIFDNELIIAPIIMEPITSGFVQITNDFTFEEAEQMAQILSVGLDLKILEVK